jgi:hypothetical protein
VSFERKNYNGGVVRGVNLVVAVLSECFRSRVSAAARVSHESLSLPICQGFV